MARQPPPVMPKPSVQPYGLSRQTSQSFYNWTENIKPEQIVEVNPSVMPKPPRPYVAPLEEVERLPQVPIDPYVGSTWVLGLDKNTFGPYVNKMDATFIMFYSPCDLMSAKVKLQIRAAAGRTRKPPMHKYAAVDCTKEGDLCTKQHVGNMPTFHLYSRGELLQSIESSDVVCIQADDIKKLVESVTPR